MGWELHPLLATAMGRITSEWATIYPKRLDFNEAEQLFLLSSCAQGLYFGYLERNLPVLLGPPGGNANNGFGPIP